MALTELDRQLIVRCTRNESGAWNDFVDRYIGLFIHVVELTAHARSVTLQPADRDDLVGEIFAEVLRDNYAILRRFREQSSLASYLTVIARRIVVREVVRRRREEGLGLDGPVQVLGEEKRVDDLDLVETLLGRLSSQEAKIVRMFHLQGRSYVEIAGLMNIPETSVGSTLTRARRQLARIGQLRVVSDSGDRAAS